MTDFALARENMINSQIATMGVIDPVLLDVLRQVPRERFVPDDKRAIAYIDEDIALADGGCLLEPMVFARLVQAAELNSGDAVLCIGDTGGYAAAVLSRLVAHVVVREDAPGRIDKARAAWASLGYRNIALESEHPRAPYDVIFINGAVPAVPYALSESLAENGRLITILRDAGISEGRAMLMTKLMNGAFSSKILFDASTPFAAGYAPRRSFAF